MHTKVQTLHERNFKVFFVTFKTSWAVITEYLRHIGIKVTFLAQILKSKGGSSLLEKFNP